MIISRNIVARTLLLAAAGWFAGCNSKIDSEPNVALEIETLSITPVSGTRSATTGQCIFTITNSSALFKNKPKNSLAGASLSPFNDITLQNVIVDYVWDDGATAPSQTFGVPGTVPAGASVTSSFPLVNLVVLGSGLTPRDGHTATLVIRAFGTTVAGEPVASDPTGGTLAINSCL